MRSRRLEDAHRLVCLYEQVHPTKYALHELEDPTEKLRVRRNVGSAPWYRLELGRIDGTVFFE